MKTKKLITTLAIVSVILFAGCKKDDFVEKVGVCPMVISTNPTKTATGVPINQIITVTFNERMNPATITQASFTLKGVLGVPGTLTYDGTGPTFSFAPTTPLAYNTTYTGKVARSVKDLMGNALQADYVWSFTTALPQYTVTLSSNPPTGGTTTGGGSFISGASVTVAATPNARYTFTNWTEGVNVVSTDPNYTFTITGNRILVANFTETVNTYTVTLSSNPPAGGTTTGAGSYDSGVSVTVAASANAGYIFTNWTEGVNIVSTNANYKFTITGNRTLVANFTESVNSYTVTLSSNPPAGGTATGAG
ncbi:MAG: Ig-like domain-containing protein, partial [Bacteroidota bacterium]